MPRNLYVGNLAYSVTDQNLNELFSGIGTVSSATVISDKFSGQSKGFGFVEMADDKQAAQAISSLDGSDFMGRNIR
jgi:RNA recognition motif-containing protein